MDFVIFIYVAYIFGLWQYLCVCVCVCVKFFGHKKKCYKFLFSVIWNYIMWCKWCIFVNTNIRNYLLVHANTHTKKIDRTIWFESIRVHVFCVCVCLYVIMTEIYDTLNDKMMFIHWFIHFFWINNWIGDLFFFLFFFCKREFGFILAQSLLFVFIVMFMMNQDMIMYKWSCEVFSLFLVRWCKWM